MGDRVVIDVGTVLTCLSCVHLRRRDADLRCYLGYGVCPDLGPDSCRDFVYEPGSDEAEPDG